MSFSDSSVSGLFVFAHVAHVLSLEEENLHPSAKDRLYADEAQVYSLPDAAAAPKKSTGNELSEGFVVYVFDVGL